MVEIIGYHIRNILQKMQSGADITNDDIAKLVGDPGYSIMRLLDNQFHYGTLSQPFVRGTRYVNKVPFRARYYANASNEAYSERYSYPYKQQYSTISYYRKGNPQSRSVRYKQRRKGWFRYRGRSPYVRRRY